MIIIREKESKREREKYSKKEGEIIKEERDNQPEWKAVCL